MSAELLSNPIDHIKLAGSKSPGLADVIGAKVEYEYAIHQGPGNTGAVQMFKRRKLSEFDVRLRLYTSDDLIEFDFWRKILEPRIPTPPRKKKGAGEPPQRPPTMSALDIWHPLLEPLDIKSVVVLSVSQLEQIDDGVWAVTIRFRENRPPVQSEKKIEASKAIPAPLDATDRVTLALTNQVEELFQELAR